jgi:C4-dicarboxylate-specific signal transduction histidine kinase
MADKVDRVPAGDRSIGRRSGHFVWSYTPFFDNNGTLKYAIATGKDLTATNCLAGERQRAEEALHRLEVTPAVQLTHLAEEAKQAALAKLNEVIAKEQEKAAQERAAELNRMNQALQAEVRERQRAEQVSHGQTETLVRTLTVLAAEPVLDNFLGYVLQAIAVIREECRTARIIVLATYDSGEDIYRGLHVSRK